jgi:hypothetical protein
LPFTWAVDADDLLLLDVAAPARAGDDRERARKPAAEGLEEAEIVGAAKLISTRKRVSRARSDHACTGR